MKKNKIIFIHFNRFLDKFDWQRYELDLLSKKFSVEVHVLINLVHPHLKNKRYSHSYDNKKVKVFDSLSYWKNTINNYKKDHHFIFQTFPYNYIALKIFLFIKSKGFKTSIIYINNLPTYKDYGYKINFLKSIYNKTLSIIFRPKHSLAILNKNIILYLFKLFPKKLSPDYSLVGGSIKKKNYFNKMVRINSWDFSNTLRKKKKLKTQSNYILYISDGETRYQSDSQLWNTKRVEDTNLYLKKLNEFFDLIEKKYNTKIKIAAHPRSSCNLKIDNRLGGRENFYGRTYELTRNARFVISWGSTALSYAILTKKPILFIYSKVLQKRNISWNRFASFYSNILKCKRLNIDNQFKKIDIVNAVDSNSYNYFIKNYIITDKFKPNHKIIQKNLV